MAFESIPFGRTTGDNAMGFQVAFCNAIAFDLADVRRLVYVSGQLAFDEQNELCLLYTSPSPRDRQKSRMPSSA